MKAVLSSHAGPPESLILAEIEPPVAGRGEAVVRVAAAALNFFDTLIIEDKYQVRPVRPFSPGAEFAGRITALGAGVTEFAIGDRVMAYRGFGAAREEIVVDAASLVNVPDTVGDDVAAGLTVTYGTTIHALKDRAGLKSGETLCVLGASGGVGVAAIELGKAFGARVIACAASPDKLEFCRRHGADAVIDYTRENLKERLKELTGGRGADVIYDPVGGELAEQALRAIAWQGRFLVVGFAAGAIPKIPLNLVLLKGCDLQGVFWGAFAEREPQAQRANMQQVLAWVGDGTLKPHVDQIFQLEETPAALRALSQRAVKGKIVIRP